jgi:hypothetical protein
MKAEHRRELNTNALADHMGRLVQGMKQPTEAGSLVLWVIGAVALLSIGGWYVFSGPASWAGYWMQFDDAPNAERLSEVASASQGTMPARAARFQKARVELREGLRSICSAEQRPKAIDELEDARQGFVELAAECKDSPLLQQEALLGAAQAEESLIGVPTKDDPAKSRGSLPRAVDLYRQIVKAYPEGYFVDVANQRIGELESNPSAVESFYAELNKLAAAKK